MGDGDVILSMLVTADMLEVHRSVAASRRKLTYAWTHTVVCGTTPVEIHTSSAINRIVRYPHLSSHCRSK